MSATNEKKVVMLSVDDDLSAVMNCFDRFQVSHIPIQEDGEIVGLVSKTDVTDFLVKWFKTGQEESTWWQLPKVSVREVMASPVVAMDAYESQNAIIEKFLNRKVGSVVIKNEGQVVGIVTHKDMIRFLYSKVENDLSFPEKLGVHLVDWLHHKGVINVSRFLSNIGV